MMISKSPALLIGQSIGLLTLCIGLGAASGEAAPEAHAAPATVLTVDTNRVLRRGADNFVGINLNYLRDADANRPEERLLQTALADLGARWLRYPGGEKSDFYLWSEPPYDKAKPKSLGWYATVPGTRLDLDQYITTARAVGAEPYIVTGYDTFERTGRTKAQWIENAVAWVRYANVVKKYGVKYWEIGNENWHNNTATPTAMAQIVTEFARAMKAVDPSIQIGSSGNNDQWWSQFLPTAAPALDFISLSLYNTWNWKSYDYITQHPDTDLIGDARSAVSAIDRYAPAADRARLKVVVAETNSKDYADNGWPGDNTLGHAIITFDTLGHLMQQERVRSAMVWTTRWVKDEEARQSQWYALGPKNEILPTGCAVALWGQFVHDKLVAIEGGSNLLSTYASCSTDHKALTVWIVNRGYAPANNIHIAIKSPVAYSKSKVWRLSGTGPNDEHPVWQQGATVPVAANNLSGLACPGVSVTVVTVGG